MNSYQKLSTVSRREFLLFAGIGVGVGTALGVGALTFKDTVLSFLGGNGSTGSRPPFPRAASTGRVREYTLEAAPVKLTLKGQQVSTWAYNGAVPGPEIKLVEGDTLRVKVKNRLPEGTTI